MAWVEQTELSQAAPQLRFRCRFLGPSMQAPRWSSRILQGSYRGPINNTGRCMVVVVVVVAAVVVVVVVVVGKQQPPPPWQHFTTSAVGIVHEK